MIINFRARIFIPPPYACDLGRVSELGESVPLWVHPAWLRLFLQGSNCVMFLQQTEKTQLSGKPWWGTET